MDPDGKRTSTRAVLLAAAGQNCWPPAGSYMAATGQDLMAADRGSGCGAVAGAVVGVSVPGPTWADRASGEAPEEVRLQALGAVSGDGSVADGRGGRGDAHRR